MKLSNFHTHCVYCDGEGGMEDFVKEAISKGFASIGFSSHSPLFFNPWTLKEHMVEQYLRNISSLKYKYRDLIEVYSGLEIDYIPGIYGPRSERFQKLGLDYSIGSVHAIEGESGEFLNVDGDSKEFEKMLYEFFKGNIEKFCKCYYSLIRDMVKIHKPDIVGHLDLIKKNNRGDRYFSEDSKWYKEEVLNTLKAIANSDCMVEVNTGGLSRNYTDTFYPSPWILKECRKLNIPVVINSDAHTPKNIDAFFEDVVSHLKKVGYSSRKTLLNGKWIDVEL